MKTLKAENGYYHNERLGLVGKELFLPDEMSEAEFVLVSEAEGQRLLAELDVEPIPSNDVSA